jgi:acetyl esterase/lipase
VALGALDHMEPRTLLYGPSSYHSVDTYGDGPNLLVFVHGGLYVNGDKAQHALLAQSLATASWTVAVVNYR